MKIHLKLDPAVVGQQMRRIPHGPNARLHWATKYRWNRAWEESVFTAVQQWRADHKQKSVPKMEKAKIEFVFYTIQALDEDNSYFCLKPLLDALRAPRPSEKFKDCIRLEIIPDDDLAHVEIAVRQVRVNRRNDERIEIIIEEK